jgi:hypothetical protein
MSNKVANVALSDTFDTWRVRSNSGFTKLFEVNPNPNTINASNTVTGGTVTSTGLATAGSLTVSGSGATALSSANTNVAGGTLLITSNTNINGTLLVNGAAPGTTDDSLAFAIALG